MSHASDLLTPQCIAPTQDILGEGPFWDRRRNRLWWFDIKGRRLNWWDPATRNLGAHPLPSRCSAGAERTDGRLLLATEAGLEILDPADGASRLLWPVESPPGFRSNDGKMDGLGRFWWSMMDDDGGRRPGAVFRTDSDTHTEQVLDDVHIPNTLVCSRDGAVLHVADSGAKTLYRHAVDPQGRLSRRQVFARTVGEAGTPDGSALDAEGYLWNAQWGAWRVVRYAPDGTIDRILPLPVEQPTSCAFGGEGLATLFITSARDGLSPEALERQPLAGGLFACQPGVTGLPLPAFAG